MIFKAAFWIGIVYVTGFAGFFFVELMSQWGEQGGGSLMRSVILAASIWPFKAFTFFESMVPFFG